MDNNWHPSEEPTHMGVQPSPQLQQFAATTEQNLPHHSRTTPEWNNQGTHMLCETFDDKNNDSGISPGHYETSPSPDRRSSENGGFSPCSSTSQESMNSPSRSYYVPQENYQNGNAPMDYAVSNYQPQTPPSQPEPNNQSEEVPKIVAKKRAKTTRGSDCKCPLCGFKSAERDILWEHLKIHYDPNRLEDEPPIPETLTIANCTPEQITERIATSVKSTSYPIINAQGHVKMITCKICKFSTITKVEFWRHTKYHIKAEKRLHCPFCPFVTDLKHHYEYHLNKEVGAKPFSCKKCPYTCVNKSMLSSHLKSHTSIRQFGCAECNYVSKYCHSLKIHLRKYGHNPSVVLNPDGTVNEYTTIDVYGTRRGPKASTILAAQLGHLPRSTQPRKRRNQARSQRSSTVVTAALPQISPPNEQQQMMPNPMAMVNPFSGNGLNSLLAMQYNHILRSNFPHTEPYANHNETAARNLHQIRANIMAEFMMMAGRIQAGPMPNIPQNMLPHYNTHSYADVPQPVAEFSAQYAVEPERAPQNSHEALDLSVPSSPSTSRANNNDNSINTVSNSQTSTPTVNQLPERSETSSSNSQRTPGTSRRKGRAVKLNRRKVENESDEGNQSEDTTTTGPRTPESSTSGGTTNDVSFNASEADNAPLLKCNFCPISFGSEAMYTIHMGYHGFKDPYTCNICGQKCDDALTFNVHLSRVSHA